MYRKDISQGEPGPAEPPVMEVEIFKSQPESYQDRVPYLGTHPCLYEMEAKPGEAHEQAIGQYGAQGAGHGCIPDPPGSRGIPEQHGEINPAEEFSASDPLLFQP